MQTFHPLQQISFTNANEAHVIEASAGTGKTWTIERLIIKALLEASQADDPHGLLSIDNILVVTFTNDASDELKQRIQEQLRLSINLILYLHRLPGMAAESASGVDLNDIFVSYLFKRQQLHDFRKDITLLSRALQNFDGAAIYTIHGFCNRVLQDYPFACSSPPVFELVANKNSVLEQLISDFMRNEIINNPRLSANLKSVLDNLQRLFSSLDFELTLEQRIASKIPSDLFILEQGYYRVKFKITASPSLAGLLDDELSADQQRQVKSEFLAYLIDYLAIHYPRICSKLNYLSYDELIQKVADALQHSPELADGLYQQFPVAFIDEFQDTDALQWQIFSTIYHLSANRRGNVVVVGDPKQAIYRFRGADVDTYLAARTLIAKQLSLERNFRSHPNIMNFINQLFSLENQGVELLESFLGDSIDYQPVEAAAAKSALAIPDAQQLTRIASLAGVDCPFYDEQVQIVAINGVTKDQRSKKLLAAMTLEILVLLQADDKLKGKIAILVTKNREASEIVNYLRKFGVKAAELKLGNIFSTKSAADLWLILTAVNNLGERRSLVRALSCQLFNLDLTKLMLVNEQSNPTLELWQKNFYRYQEIWQLRGIISLVYALIEDVVSSTAADLLTTRELANIWQLAELLNKQANKLHNHDELLFWFKQKIDRLTEELGQDIDGANEELVRLDNDDEQIIITTQHKAKGLEFEILFCPYFKSGIVLDGQYDFNYRRPFFSNHSHNGINSAALITDSKIGQQIVLNDNKEAHRLNYVALTRAKSRLYIYLKQPTISPKTAKYNSLQRPEKLNELFGYQGNNIADDSHRLFNYPLFFSSDPGSALKQPLPGVRVYNRDLLDAADLAKLRYVLRDQATVNVNFSQVSAGFNPRESFVRQSYSGLCKVAAPSGFDFKDYFVTNEVVALQPPSYRYSILSDPVLKGAVFGNLFHELCENYPFSQEQLGLILQRANICSSEFDYRAELMAMLDEAFNYPLINDLTLATLKHSIHELEFNLVIHQTVTLHGQLADLIAEYFGPEHAFSLACRLLQQIDSGFLGGFMDVFFEYAGKFWVLDYKTNGLDEYPAANPLAPEENSLIASMAEHHYYLQYLLYLVAIKRYLEQRLNLADASHLLGGAIYFYVRGIYCQERSPYQGIYLDQNCQSLVAKLDALFKGVC